MSRETFQVADDAFVIPGYWQTPGAPFGVHLNSMVLRGSEPAILDTGIAAAGEEWFDAVCSVVEPDDVRWIIITHDDADHTGNVASALARCPNATLVTTWFMTERMGPEVPVDPRRLRWVGPGGSLDVGDRTLSFHRPPLYDSPTTRVVFDPASGVLWAGDLFATPVTAPTTSAADLDPGFLHDGFLQFQQYNSPWVEMVDGAKYRASVDALASLPIAAIASTHGPAFLGGEAVSHAFELLHEVPGATVPPEPDQAMLEAIVAAIAGGHA